jgi:hypothetical protein
LPVISTGFDLEHSQTSLKRMIWNWKIGLIEEDEIKTVMAFPKAETGNLSDAE